MRAKKHDGLKEVAALLPDERSLVFWFSDFYFPESEAEEFLALASPHKVLGVSFCDGAEINIPRFGLVGVRDAESGKIRSIFIRPSVRKQMAREREEKEKRLKMLFEARGAEIYFNKGEADLEKFQNWLLS